MAVAVVFAGGGTGGHIFPALALAEALRKERPDAHVRFVGTKRGLEVKHVRAAGHALDLVPSQPVLGRGTLGKLRALATLARGVVHALRILRRARPDLVVGVGGYASVPTLVAARLLRVPTALLEANARPGRANRLMGRFAERVYVQFEGARAFFAAERVAVSGFPVREIPRGVEVAPSARVRLLVMGGSQGARSINRAILDHLDRIEGPGVEITHQTGPYDLETVREAYSALGSSAEVGAFFDDLPLRLARADLVVARAGASTIAEICCAGVAAVLVPYPHAADDHQMANARELERAGAACVIPDGEVDRRLGDEVRTLIGEPGRRERMAAAARARGVPDAAERIVRDLLAWLAARGSPPAARRPETSDA